MKRSDTCWNGVNLNRKGLKFKMPLENTRWPEIYKQTAKIRYKKSTKRLKGPKKSSIK
jgi:hypothetical protein